MAVAYLDRVDTLSLVERNGVIRSLTRKARVVVNKTELPAASGMSPVAFLAAALGMVPDSQSTLTETGYNALVLVERSPSVSENDPSVVDIILKYEHILEGPNQRAIDPVRGTLFGKGRASISEKTTNFYYPNGVSTDAKGGLLPRSPILVAHTFPQIDQGIAGLPLNPVLPRTVIQTGEITIPFPQANFQMQGVLNTSNPWAVANRFIAKINSAIWLMKPAYTWLCTEVQWDVLDTAPPDGSDPLYHFAFEFQYNQDTWNPTVVFNDQRTGRPPAGVVFANVTADHATIDPLVANAAILAAAAVANPIPANIVAAAQAALALTSGIIGPIDGVLRLTRNPVNNNLQPAGVWTVPALEVVNFPLLFRATFEDGAPPPLIA